MQRPLVGYILAKNEEGTIEDAVRSLQRVTEHVVVVDSESVDATRERAGSCGAEVWTRPFDSFPAQRNWALDEIERKLSARWTFCLDADEILDDDLVHDLNRRLDDDRLEADVYVVRRIVRFDGRPLRWGGFSKACTARLLRAGVARYGDRLVNESLDLPASARVGTLSGAIEHADVSSWERYIDKHNRYSSVEAQVRSLLERGAAGVSASEALRRPDLRRRWLREQVWNRAPARPALRFAHIYLLRGGVLDGRAGFRRALFEAWQEMCIDLKAEAIAAGRGT
jgi:hypothetical protein